MLVHMHPATLVSNVRHLEKVDVESGFSNGFSEKRFMGSWGARRHNYTVKIVLLYLLYNPLLRVFRACIQVVLSISDIW